ncbi:hypothetical protein DERF_004177 [Dermatophagoides farinae]|uniref:Uncharacterized protein n=1 Tax=Dermatophagoides farinae TaxID=6954 RepID=A0A922I3E0_DERFA|nr:hypothetical protein DERF_004177 [Dermatophagoides farinae]
MAHWSDYSLRGWLSFLAFMHIGLCLRSFFDPNFLFGKIFHTTIHKEMVFVHYFGCYSIIQAFILIQSAIHLYVLPLQTITIFLLIVFITLIMVESFYYCTLDLYGATLLPFMMSVISLIWLILFHFIWKPWLHVEINEDIVKSCLLHPGHHQGHHHNKRHKSNHHHHHQYSDRMSISSSSITNHRYGKIHSD